VHAPWRTGDGVHRAGRQALCATDAAFLVDALAEWPLERRVAAGLYRLDIVSDPPFLRREKILNIKPPSHATSIKVTP
jgi:hypothetical protein